jgi:hypothetical protein
MAQAAPAECPAILPAGINIRVFPDEPLTSGTTTGPTIFTVATDVRFFPNRPPLLARGSKILATIVESKQAGRIHGKARLRIALTSILTSDLCEYPIDARIVQAGRNKVEDNVVWGRGHAKRDIVALLFPPTTIYQLLRIPSRGPKLTIDNETSLTIKLLQPVSLGMSATSLGVIEKVGDLRPRPDPVEREIPAARPASLVQHSPIPEPEVAQVSSRQCTVPDARSPALPIVQRMQVVRPVRNLTPYHVSLALDRTPILIMPPCYGPAMITTPTSEFKLEASASLLTTGGQRQIRVKIVPNSGNGWDILPDTGEPVAAN